MIDFSELKFVVAGEIGMDVYLEGTSNRKSPEHDVPVINDVQEYRYPGMSANLAQNLVALGCQVQLCSVNGYDADATRLNALSDAVTITTMDPDRPTIKKTRLVCNGTQLARIDTEDRSELNPDILTRFVKSIIERLKGKHGLFLQDYGKGLWDWDSIQEVIKHAQKNSVPVFVDPNMNRPLECYEGCWWIKPNRAEAVRMFELQGFPKDPGQSLAREIRRRLGSETYGVTVTLGPDGSVTSTQTNLDVRVPALPVDQVVDVAGAGDTFLAVLGTLLVGKPELDLERVLQAAHFASANVIRKPRTTVVDLPSLQEYLE